MPLDPAKHMEQSLTCLLLKTIEEFDPPRGIVLSALEHCRNHFDNRTKVETAVLVAGCGTSNFLWDLDLELYYDITKEGRDVAYISKGWDDPGFRLGEVVIVPEEISDRLNDVKAYCDTNGVVMSIEENEGSTFKVVFEYLIYSTGFDGLTFSQALSTLIECSEKLKNW